MLSSGCKPTPPSRILSSIAIALHFLEAITLAGKARLPRRESDAPAPSAVFVYRAWTGVLLGAICIGFVFELGLCVQCQFEILLFIIASAGFYPELNKMRGAGTIGLLILLWGLGTVCVFVWYKPLRRFLDYGEQIPGITWHVPTLTAIITLAFLAYVLFYMYRTIKHTLKGDPILIFTYGVSIVGETFLLAAYGLEYDRHFGPATVTIRTVTASSIVILAATQVLVAAKHGLGEWPSTRPQE